MKPKPRSCKNIKVMRQQHLYNLFASSMIDTINDLNREAEAINNIFGNMESLGCYS